MIVGIFKYNVVKVNFDEYTFTDLLEAFSASTFSEAAEIALKSIEVTYSSIKDSEVSFQQHANRWTVSVAGEYYEILEITPHTEVTHL